MIDSNKLKQIILNVIKSSDPIDSINDDTVLIGNNGLFLDSIDVLELIVEIEKNFGIKIRDKDLDQEKLKNFKTFYNFLNANEK